MVTIIIPAYKASKYIDECLASLSAVDVEILIGVDGCEETYNHIKHLDNVFYFPKNVGPYVIKNTLVDIAKNEYIIFFDADDVMITEAIENILDALYRSDYVKLNYINFQDRIKPGQVMNDAVVAIKKSVFNSLNGFYPWRCGADTEFAYRLQYNNLKEGRVEQLCYYRRLHNENLTMRKETGHGSPIRSEYVNIINRNIRANSWPTPQTKTTYTYVKD
ncbi:MAG: glycosyltransferase family 2 protein [Alphaproteobacteria bacterium]|nr:glycosyltransferase family 2 protein [Alphaproteobacteria bacterium]